jgi:hypothetical protein
MEAFLAYKFVRPRAYPRVEHLIGASLRKALALLANNTLGWEGLKGKTL